MSELTSLQSADNGETSRGIINDNFDALNADKLEGPGDNGTDGQFLMTDGMGGTSWETASLTPAGDDGQLQFNNGGVLGAAELFYTTEDTEIRLKGGLTTTSIKFALQDNIPDSVISLYGGDITSGGAPGFVEVYSGAEGYGGDVRIFAGDGLNGDNGGGNVTIQAGGASGSGFSGNVYITSGVNGGDSGYIYLSTGNTYVRLDTFVNLTDERTIEFPDADGTFMLFTSGSGVPGSTPMFIGQAYLDTSGQKLYVSFGTSSSSDWKIMN